jgi:hypothetical protein
MHYTQPTQPHLKKPADDDTRELCCQFPETVNKKQVVHICKRGAANTAYSESQTAFENGFAYGWANFGHMTTGNRMLSYDKQVSIFQVCGHNNRITNANNDCDLHAIWN